MNRLVIKHTDKAVNQMKNIGRLDDETALLLRNKQTDIKKPAIKQALLAIIDSQ